MKLREARRVTAPAVQQHHARAAVAPVPHGEFVRSATQRGALPPARRWAASAGSICAALRCEKRARNASLPASGTLSHCSKAKHVRSRRCSVGRDARNHASKNWFAALFHDLVYEVAIHARCGVESRHSNHEGLHETHALDGIRGAGAHKRRARASTSRWSIMTSRPTRPQLAQKIYVQNGNRPLRRCGRSRHADQERHVVHHR